MQTDPRQVQRFERNAEFMTSVFGLFAAVLMSLERGENIADSGSFFYEVYECKDGKLISIAPIEAKFFAELLQRIGIGTNELPLQSDKSSWERGKALLADIFAIEVDGVVQPVPAPRFSRTSPDPLSPPKRAIDIRIEDALQGWMSPEQISALKIV